MKIAIVINTSWNIYNFRMGLIKKLQAEGHEVVAIAPVDDYSAKLIAAGCLFVPISMENKGTNPIKDFFLILKYVFIFLKVKPDYILQYTVKPNIYGTFAAQIVGIPTINNVSGLGTIFLHHNLVSKIAKFLYKLAFKFPKRVFFQNADDQELFIANGLINRNITDVLPGSGVNLTHYVPLDFQRNEPFVFIFIARLLYDKGLVEYVEAIKLLQKQHVKAKFQVLGFTDFESKLGVPKLLLDAWIEEGYIDYLGHTSDVIPFINAADCVVLPSYREGTPKTLIEALALAKPIVTTNVPGCKETVNEGLNGLLCEAKNPQDLAAKMLQLYKLDNNDLNSMGLNGRKLAEIKFDEKIVVKKYLDIIN
jgi:glycosyltransferase involved in cell wall biosynthesis